EQATVVDAQRGGIIGVSARKLADEQIVIAGGQVRATRYTFITPYYAGSIWYDKANLWVRGEFERDGSKVQYQLVVGGPLAGRARGHSAMPFRRPLCLAGAIMASTVAGCMAVSVALAPTPVTLATGTPGGIYHSVVHAICRMF